MQTCLTCGESLDAAKLRHGPRSYCSPACANRAPEKRLAHSAYNRRRWEQWRAAGVDPTHTPEANGRRGVSLRPIMEARWRQWRTWKRKPPVATKRAIAKRRATFARKRQQATSA